MFGTLGDVLMFQRNGNGRTGSVTVESEGVGAMITADEENAGGSGKRCGSFIEWQQLLKDGVSTHSKANASGNVIGSKFSVAESDRSILLEPHNNFMTGPWDGSVRGEGRVVNYLQSFGPAQHSQAGVSRGRNVDRELGEIRLNSECGRQLLSNVMSPRWDNEDRSGRPTDEEEFGRSPASAQSRMTLGQGSISGISQQHLFISPSHGLGLPSSACIQQLNRSPNHGIRNLFPEKSSNFSSVDDSGINAVDKQLLHVPKKSKRQESIDFGLNQARVDGSSRGQLRKSFSMYQRNALSSLMTGSSSFEGSSPSFPSSFPADRSNLSLQNGSCGSSTFRSSPPQQLLSAKNEANDGATQKSPIVDYTHFPFDGTKMDAGGFREQGDILLDRTSSQSGGAACTSMGNCSFMHPGLLGQAGFYPRNTLAIDVGSSSAWPASLINIPALSIKSPPSRLLPSRNLQRDSLDLSDRMLEDREGPRGHSGTDSKRRLLIQKQLTVTDVGSLGRIILPKKEAEMHLPQLPDKEGIEMRLYDHEADRTWVMKYRFWPNNKSRMYLLENTGDFTKFHALQSGDWLHIYRERVSIYIVKAKKTPPVRHIAPPAQSVTEPAAASGRTVAVAEEQQAGGAAAGVGNAGMTMIMSTSIASTCGSPLSSKEMMMMGATTTAKGSNSSHHIPLEGTNVSFSSHPQPSETTSAPDHREDEDEQQHIKDFMVDVHVDGAQHQHHQQLQNQEITSDLDGGGVFNLEDFPRLIEADDEMMNNILDATGPSCDMNSINVEEGRIQKRSFGGSGGNLATDGDAF